MKSNIKEYLRESILAGISKIREDDEDELDDQPEAEDSYYKADDDNDQDWDEEPQQTQVTGDQSTRSLYGKQEKLQQLLDKKDVILMQYKSGQMSLDQYRDAIGNIPQQIKTLRDQIAASLEADTDLGDEEEN